MSRRKTREQKKCLNCETPLNGRYCHNCGQENIEIRETVWHLISHFFKDITHFDGKFFSTFRYMIAKPGFVSKEYLRGRRASYVNPVRMYVFTSAIFFLIFFSVFKVDRNIKVTNLDLDGKTYEQIMALDSSSFKDFIRRHEKIADSDSVLITKDQFKAYFDSTINKGFQIFRSSKYKSKAAYDSLLNAGQKDCWLQRQATYKAIEISEKYKNNFGQAAIDFSYIILHSLPQMLFILLPLFALILKMLYIRRKKYFYVDHAIFSIHFYIFCFINMLVIFGLGKLNEYLDWGFITFSQVVLVLILFFYLYKAMRRYYEQQRAKTIFKFLLLCLTLMITMAFLFMGFILFSFFKF